MHNQWGIMLIIQTLKGLAPFSLKVGGVSGHDTTPTTFNDFYKVHGTIHWNPLRERFNSHVE